MSVRVSRLSVWFALGAVLMVATVAGMYFYAQYSLRKMVRAVPAKLGVEIQQTAEGFSISKSTNGRTQFTVSASKAVQFKEGGRSDLHNVKIVIYGKDASRFDRIAGDEFEYDPGSGNVKGKGRVLIDLQTNPEGIRHPDQSPPAQIKTPLHLETDDLVFNKNTGDASATGKVIFQTPQASGSAVGMQYVAKTGTMNLLSAVELTINRPQPVHLEANHGVITKQPHQVFLTTVRMTREREQAWSDQATFFLREDNTVERVLAEGNVKTEVRGQAASKSKTSNLKTASMTTTNLVTSSPTTSNLGTSSLGKSSANGTSVTRERSDRAELFLTGTRNLLTMAILTGNVQMHSEKIQDEGARAEASEPADAAAGRATLHFSGEQVLRTIHAEDGVRLTQKNSRSGSLMASSTGKPMGKPQATMPSGVKGGSAGQEQGQDVEMTAPVMDFLVKDGRLLENAETSGPPQIVITQPGSNQKTVVTAGKFTAKFTEKNRLSTLHGEPDAKIVSSLIDAGKNEANNRIAMKPGSSTAGPNRISSDRMSLDRAASDRISTSRLLDVAFLPEGGVQSITQTGEFTYVDGTQKAWAQRGEYTTVDEMVVLTGSPRVVDGGMMTTAKTVRMNRATGDAAAEGNVKSTYNDLKAQPDGALLASSDPIHVTSRSMTAHRASSIAVYTGDARLWQDANIVEAPTLEFDRDHRSLFAYGDSKGTVSQPVSTVLVQVDKAGNATPVRVTSERMKYTDAEREAFFDGGVTARQTDATMTGDRMTVFLLPRSQKAGKTNSAAPGQIDRIITEKHVVIVQPTRHATGERLVYTSADDKYVLTGGSNDPPSIFDAERGKTTGDSLTFYRRDDRVLVEGREKSPAVTRTQVAR
jgi:lipopolysaccharide export system protein LptA